MFFKKVIFSIALGLLIFDASIDGACHTCSSTSYASCLNETAFHICFDGVTKSELIAVCPEDQVCTDLQGVCKPRATHQPTCGVCNVCLNGFACISSTQFEYCSSATTTGIIGKCPDGQYCSLLNLATSRNICIASCTGLPTCYKEAIISTPKPEPNYTDICARENEQGFYVNTYDATCETYVYCEILNGVMNSILYKCASGYYSAADKNCVDTKPSNCA